MNESRPEDPVPEEELVPADDARIGRAFRVSLLLAAGVVALSALVYLALQPREAADTTATATVAAPRAREVSSAPPAVHFADVTLASGLEFVHVNGAYGERLLPETMGGGVAFFDYDADGDPDLLLVNSDHWPGRRGGAPRARHALYRNDGAGRFEDVTAEAGLDVSFYGMGVACADYDGDGWSDVFFSALGENRLFRNRGGRFEEVTARAGVAGAPDAWSTAAAFFDADGDLDLDLFVGNYVRWSREIDLGIDFQLTGIGRAYGPPTTFEGSHPYLYRNDGNGRFTDVSESSGVQVNNPATGRPVAKSLAVAPVDVDGDGRLDLLVANDTVQNFLYRNLGAGRFSEEGASLGVAFDRNGGATGAMGVDSAFYRDDHALAFAIGNFANEMTSFYAEQEGALQFADEAIGEGVGAASRLALTFGLFFFDYDLDGRLDLFQANGHIEDEINRVQPSQRYEQPPQLFWNCGGGCPGTYVEVAAASLGELARPLVGRGAAYADVDADGDLDLLVTQVGRRPALYRNEQALGRRFLRVKAAGRAPNRDAIGAWIEVEAGGRVQRRQVMPTRSYLSQMELPLTFGLGEATHVDALRVVWPDGLVQEVPPPPVDASIVVEREG